MVNSMPEAKKSGKIWVLNLDDFIFKDNALDALKNYSPKYMQILKPGDLCIISPHVSPDISFVNYTARVKKITNKNWVIMPKKHNLGEPLTSAVCKDKALLNKLKKLCAGNYIMIPLLYTKGFEELSRLCGNKIPNNSSAVREANDKLEFKKLCKRFNIATIKPVFEKGKNNKFKIPAGVDRNQNFLLKRSFSAGGYDTVKGNLAALLNMTDRYQKEGRFLIEKFEDIYRTLGSLCMLKEDGVHFAGIDCQIIKKEAWEGCSYPFKKFDRAILKEIKDKSLQLAKHYYKKGVRGQVNFDWAIIKRQGRPRLYALECNCRYNGFGLCLRLASTVYNIPREKAHFYLDSKIKFSGKLTTSKLIAALDKINARQKFRGGIVLTSAANKGKAGFCFIAENEKNLKTLRAGFKKIALS